MKIPIFVKLLIVLAIFALFAALAFLFVRNSYNTLVNLEEGVISQWAQVENVYQRRADLIPNLVSVVKGYAAHERETLEAVVEARNLAYGAAIDPRNINPETIAQFQATQDGLSSALSRLMVVVEAYPDLKAYQGFLNLQTQLEGSENRIANARRKYAEAVRDYNISIREFPRNIFANMFGFEPKAHFEAAEGAEVVPEIVF